MFRFNTPTLTVLFSLWLFVSPSQAQLDSARNTRRADASDNRQLKRKENADQLLQQARSVANDWSKTKRIEALKVYEKAGLLYAAIGDVPNQLAVLFETGEIQECSGDASIALDKYTRALTLAREARDRRAEATALNRIGFWHIDRSNFQKSFDYGKQAHDLSLSIADRDNEAEALLLLGTATYHLRHIEPARDYLNSSLAIFSTTNDKRNEARVIEMLGHVSYELGNVAEALRLFRESLSLARRISDPQQTGKALNALAITLSIRGEKQEAVEHYRQALEIFDRIGDRLHEAIAQNGLGFIYYTLGENQRSLHYYYKALQLFKSVGDREGEGFALARIGKNSEALWDKKTAVQYYEKLRVLAREVKDPIFESYALNWQGDVIASSNMRVALSYYEQALALTRQYKNPRNEAYTLNRLGYTYAALGEVDTAQKYYDTALQLAQTINDREGESITSFNLAVLERGRNRLAQAQSLIERSLKLTESLSTAVGDRDLRASYFAGVHQRYEFYIDLLMALHEQDRSAGFAARALEASERSRSRSLLEMLGEGRADITHGVDAQLLKQEQLAREKLTKAIQKRLMLFRRQHSSQEAENSKQEILTLTTEHEQILATIRQRSPQYAALTQPLTLTAPQMQSLLDDETVMVEYSMGERKSFAWAVTKDGIESFELPQRSTLEEMVRNVYEDLSNNPNDPAVKRANHEAAQPLRTLSDILLKPLAKQADKKRVVIVADGALQYIPFSVLQTSATATGKLLLDQYEVVNLPSASALAVQRQTRGDRDSAARALAVIADPVFELDDERFAAGTSGGSTRGPKGRSLSARKAVPSDADVSNVARALRSIGLGPIQRLPFSGREANAVFGFISSPDEGLELVGFQANRQNVLDADLAQYRMVHFATHGLVDNEHPQLSGLMLSTFDEHGRKQNGFLALNEIYNLRLSADLVVLSACQTGLGKLIRGEGIVGLTRGFMYAGSRRVVASLWRVDDRATADLMKAFYRGMLKDQLKPADALRAAQRELRQQRRFQHPYYWAGFVLQGEWK